MTVEKVRAECVRHYVERGHTPAHAELIVPKDEAEIRRIYGRIQEEMENAKHCRKIPRPIAGLNIFEIVEIAPTEETAAEWAAVFFLSKSQGERERKIFGQRC